MWQRILIRNFGADTMGRKNIVIVGYPKSGTTWASRLIAELIQSPVQGDWGYSDINEAFTDTQDRSSDYCCFKSHHSYDTLYSASKLPIHKVIYILRDPRDIAISAAHYFQFPSLLANWLSKAGFKKFSAFSRKLYTKTLPFNSKKKMMIAAVLQGNSGINRWMGIPWKIHYQGYQHKDILAVTYEQLLDQPFEACRQILEYLQVQATETHIRRCVKNQAFENRKKEVLAQNNAYLKKLVRKGSYGYWKDDFTAEEKELFRSTLDGLADFYDF